VDVEMVDLAQILEPITYAKVAPRDYRKLHSLHTSVQSDNAVRLPKQKPAFSYASGQDPNLPFLHKNEAICDPVRSPDSDYDEFPSLSEMAPVSLDRKPSPDIFESFNLRGENPVPPSFPDNSLGDLEAGLLEPAETEMNDEPSPKIDPSFAKGVFDFDAFRNDSRSKNSSPTKETLTIEPSPTLIMKESLKRDRSATPEFERAKHRRVTKDEPISQAAQAAVPDWVNEFDSDLINELKGFVDFVD
jgi:ATP-dependent DNA helicase HFM1/MER3